MVVASVSAAGCLIAFISIIYRLLIDNDSITEIQNSVSFYAIVGSLVFAVSSAISVYNIVYGEIYDKETDNLLYFMNFIRTVLDIGQICIYLLFMSRIKKIFDNSPSRISSVTSITFYILLFILYITTTISTLIYSSYRLITYSTVIMIIAECCHLSLASMLIYTYLSRLVSLFFVRNYENQNPNRYNNYGSNGRSN